MADTTVTDWLQRLRTELELDDLSLDVDDQHVLLDLARDAAHQVDRPAAPLTTFLVGVAVGRGGALGAAAARATALALDVTADGPGPAAG